MLKVKLPWKETDARFAAKKQRRHRVKAVLRQAEDEPGNSAAQARAAAALIRLKRFDEANAVLERALYANPRHAELVVTKALLFAKTQRRDDAIALLLTALQACPQHGRDRARMHAVLAEIMMESARLDEAEEELGRAHSADSNYNLDSQYAHLALRRGEWQEAASLLERYTNARPKAAPSWRFLHAAVQLEKLGNTGRAWEIYVEAIGPELAADPKLRAFYDASAMRRIRTNSLLSKAARSREFNNFSNVAPLEEFLARRIAARQPTSLLRMADGEGRALSGKDPHIGGAVLSRSRQEPLTPDELSEFQALFCGAIEEADILGLPTEDMLRNPDNRSVITSLSDDVIARIAAGNVMVVDQLCHYHMHEAGSYTRLLHGLDFVGVVSGRNITEYLREAFGVHNVAWMPIPAQATHGELEDRPHYPDRYREVVATLGVPCRGAVFLVAGGQVGKVYCGEIRRRGGIALDIGAVADLWVGLRDTRPYAINRPDLAAQ